MVICHKLYEQFKEEEILIRKNENHRLNLMNLEIERINNEVVNMILEIEF